MLPIQCLNNSPTLKKSGLRSQVLNDHPTQHQQHEHHSIRAFSPSASLFGISPVPVRVRAPPAHAAPTSLSRITPHDGVHGRRPERHRAHDAASLREQGGNKGGRHQEKTTLFRGPQHVHKGAQVAQREILQPLPARGGNPNGDRQAPRHCPQRAD